MFSSKYSKGLESTIILKISVINKVTPLTIISTLDAINNCIRLSC